MPATPQPYFWSCRGWASTISSPSPKARELNLVGRAGFTGPTRAVVVANQAAELEGNDAGCKNDRRSRTAAAGRGQGARRDGACAGGRSEADAGQRSEGG